MVQRADFGSTVFCVRVARHDAQQRDEEGDGRGHYLVRRRRHERVVRGGQQEQDGVAPTISKTAEEARGLRGPEERQLRAIRDR